MVDKFIKTIQDHKACIFIGQQRPLTEDQACEALDSWLMGRNRVGQQSAYAGVKPVPSKETFVIKKGANDSNPKIEQLTNELSELKKSLNRVLQSNRDRKVQQSEKLKGARKHWKSPSPHIRQKYNLPNNNKCEGCLNTQPWSI
jgi:hypothetical protein